MQQGPHHRRPGLFHVKYLPPPGAALVLRKGGMVMSVQVCPYHDRLQKDVNSLTDLVLELREWRAAQEERQNNMEEKLDQAIAWMKWVTGLSVTTALGLLGAVVTLLAGR